VRALAADCHRDLGDTALAVGEYDVLVAESLGTAREAVMRQHRGKALLANGEAERAIEDFQQAVELRRTADTVLLDSAEQALVVARGRVTIR
jgi:Flp pilus assembly protein TadD